MFLNILKGAIYNKLILFTADSYKELFHLLKPHSRVLDVGIGTAEPIIKNFELLTQKDIHIHGIDIDRAYLEQAQRAILQKNATNYISVEYADITEKVYAPIYDAVYFSDSFMLIPFEKRKAALLNAMHALKDNTGEIYFTQTHEKEKSRLLEILKPKIKFLTSIDFGLVTYEQEFLETLQSVGLTVKFKKEILGSKRRSLMLIVASVIEVTKGTQ